MCIRQVQGACGTLTCMEVHMRRLRVATHRCTERVTYTREPQMERACGTLACMELHVGSLRPATQTHTKQICGVCLTAVRVPLWWIIFILMVWFRLTSLCDAELGAQSVTISG